jgi:predicted acetyltransferase
MPVQLMAPEDYATWAKISANAYPAFDMTSNEDQQHFVERARKQAEDNPAVVTYGCYRDGTLLGGMRLYDYEMNMLGTMIPAGGVGAVAVDLAHKKEKVARDLIQFCVRHYRERGAPITLLYPFRPDFYKDMGYGYGTKLSQYRILPEALPAGGDRSRVGFAGRDDLEQIVACYDRLVRSRHGMMLKARYEINGLFSNPANRMVAYRDGETVRGYLRFSFEQRNPDNFTLNDLVVSELIYETREALAGLLAFLRSQADQVTRIVLTTQDETFFALLRDPRNGGEPMIPSVYHESHLEGVGLMYRVSDVPAVFRLLGQHDFGGQTATLRLVVHDTFIPENDVAVVVHFEDGRARVLDGDASGADAEVRLDVAEFSSLLMGCVPFERLYLYGLAEISDARQVEAVDRVFRTREKPMCVTPF